MARKFKHRVVVEVTSNQRITERQAVNGLQILFDIDQVKLRWRKPWVFDNSPLLKIGHVKQFSLVHAAENRNFKLPEEIQ